MNFSLNLKSIMRRLFVQIPILSFELSGRSIPRSLFLYVKFLYFTFSRKFYFKNYPLNFNFNFQGKPFSLQLLTNLDTAVLVEIFVLKEYDWVPEGDIGRVLDLGAHWGDTAIYYALRFPAAKIISVEPMPDTYERLKRVTRAFPNVETIQAALGEKTGQAVFHYSNNSLGNSLSKRAQSKDSIIVPTLSPKDLFDRTGSTEFDLVKFDIEGGETTLFKYANLQLLSRSYIGEIHLDMIDMNLEEIKNCFKGFDVQFDKLKGTRYIIRAVRRV